MSLRFARCISHDEGRACIGGLLAVSQCPFAFVCHGFNNDSVQRDDFSLQTCQSGGSTEGRGLEDNGKPCFLLKGLTRGSAVLQPGPAPQPHLPHAAH